MLKREKVYKYFVHDCLNFWPKMFGCENNVWVSLLNLGRNSSYVRQIFKDFFRDFQRVPTTSLYSNGSKVLS